MDFFEQQFLLLRILPILMLPVALLAHDVTIGPFQFFAAVDAGLHAKLLKVQNLEDSL